MFVIDQLKRADRPLQVLAGAVLAGLIVLMVGLWYVQVVSAQHYQKNLNIQSFRTVRVPAIRGKILDRFRTPLAENRPAYNLNLYLEELRPAFRLEYMNFVKKEFLAGNPNLTNVPRSMIPELERQARCRVVSNQLYQISSLLQNPQVLIPTAFERHYTNQRSLPFLLMKDLKPEQVAAFVERAGEFPGVDLETQPVRVYPLKSLAAHLIGHLRRDDRPGADEEMAFKFVLPDYIGARGLEAAFDDELRGRAGVKSVLVNSMAYRESEEMILEPEPGRNVVLTLDTVIQQATELALGGSGSSLRAAAVVMHVHSGDILAIASSPTFDPNLFITPPPAEEWQKLWELWQDEKLLPMFNRAAYGTFPAGSTFKIVVALAGLEAGQLDPREIYHSKGFFQLGGRGRPIRDTAGEGEFDFSRAFYKSSNPYFIEQGLRLGPDKMIEMGRRLGLGQRTGLVTKQETAGYLPESGATKKHDGTAWMPGDTANLAIGHGEILVTPLQMAVLTAAVANGGKVIQPRIVSAIEPPDQPALENTQTFPVGVVRGEIKVSRQNLEVVQKAMRADVEHPQGTGRRAAVPGYPIAGKTGTAQLPKEAIVWFVSYAPSDAPEYAVVVVVSGGESGSSTCAPIARRIYEAILDRQRGGRLLAALPGAP